MTTFLTDFFQLTKFEIVVLEIITLVAGYFIGRSMELPMHWGHFLVTALGVTFLAMGAGTFNQIQEKNEDALMDRTKKRPLPSGRISLQLALGIALALAVLGLALLYSISIITFALGFLAILSYNVLYTMWWKRKMAFAAIPGAIPGAIPILIGYQAAVGLSSGLSTLSDPRGYYLFAILFFWQMPHFWVLALKYSNDYDQGGFPTLPVAKGRAITREQITLWCLAYCGLGLLSALFFPIGIIGIIGTFCISAWLILELVRFLKHPEQKTWLRFFLSINFSLILYLFIIMADLLSIYLHPHT